MKRTVWRVCAASVLTLSLAGVSACSAPDGDSASARGGAPVTGDPKTWTLPLQGYMPDEKQEKLLTDARESLIATCMARYGFSYEPAPPMPEFGPESMTDLRYGIHDADVVRRYGYKPPVDLAAVRAEERAALESTQLSPEEEAVMTGRTAAGAGPSTRRAVPQDGCAGEAYRRLMGNDQPRSTLATDLSNTAYTKAQQEPAVKESFSAWSDCMAEKGYEYAKPMDAVDDPEFAADTPSSRELATAGADLDCRKKHRVAPTWYQAEAALQTDLIETHAERLQALKADLAKAVKNASRVLNKEG